MRIVGLIGMLTVAAWLVLVGAASVVSAFGTVAIVMASVAGGLGILYALYRALPVLSEPWRVKVVTDGYRGQLEVVLVKRFASGSYSSDRVVLAALYPGAENFDEQLAEALFEARHRARMLSGMQRRSRTALR